MTQFTSLDRRRSSRDSANAQACGPGFGELTPALISAATGTFSLETVFKFSWCQKALQRISGLEKCTALIELDLTGNSIADMSGLEALVSLRKLTLTGNRIQDVTGLQTLISLEHLLLQANLISSFQSCNLGMLAKLPHLRTLYLRNIDQSQANAVCRHRDYKRTILAALPSLGNLDGERNPCESMYVHQVEEVTELTGDLSPYEPKFDFSPPLPWFKPQDFEVPAIKMGLVDVAAIEATLVFCDSCYRAVLQELQETKKLVSDGG